MSLGLLLFSTAAGLACVMSFAWLLQRRTGQSGWIDATWSFAIGVAGVALALAPLGEAPPGARQYLVAAFALVGAVRLGVHIVGRSLNAGEDPRYHDLAVEWGADFPRRLFWFLQIQAACAFLLSLAVFLAARNPVPFPAITDVVGALILIVAILGEAWSDATLARFPRDSRPGHKRLHERPLGLFETSQLFLSVVKLGRLRRHRHRHVGTMAPGLARACSRPPSFIGFSSHVSGVPPLEKHMLASRGEAFRAYQSQVNAFFPGPRRRA